MPFGISDGNAAELGREMDKLRKERTIKSKETTYDNNVRQIWKIIK